MAWKQAFLNQPGKLVWMSFDRWEFHLAHGGQVVYWGTKPDFPELNTTGL